MNMLKSFLLDEMFPNVCDKLCKLFSKQKTFNFTQHIPPWKGKQEQRHGVRRADQLRLRRIWRRVERSRCTAQ